jgi:hypothetical protein
LLWREQFTDNAALDYRFVQRGTDVSGATFSIIDGREDLFYMHGADLKLTNSSDWGSIGTTNYVRLQASVGAATNELVVAAGVISGASAGTIFMFR